MEQTVKKRGWVKNAAIIFLAVMLVLTFFSNTIMNRSLPEAATVLCMPGTIDSKVRVSGTVTATENYTVILDQTRKVLSVAVKQGQEVSTGDLLFTLEPGDSTELEQAREELRQAQYSYQRMLINASSSDYSRENRGIEQAREALVEAQAKADALADTGEQEVERDLKLRTARARVAEAQEKADALADTTELEAEQNAKIGAARAKADEAQTKLEEAVAALETAAQTVAEKEAALSAAKAELSARESVLKGIRREQVTVGFGLKYSSEGSEYNPPSLSGLSEKVSDARGDLAAAENDLTAAEMMFGAQYALFEAAVKQKIDEDYGGTPTEGYDTYLPYYMQLFAADYKEYDQAAEGTEEAAKYAQYVAYAAISEAQERVALAQSALVSAQSALDDAATSGDNYIPPVNYEGKSHSYWEKESQRLELAESDAQEQVDEAGEVVQAAESALTAAQSTEAEAKAAEAGAKDALEAAKSAVTEAEQAKQEALKAREGEHTAALETLKSAVTEAELAREEVLKTREDEYAAALETVKSAQNSLADLLFSLEQQKKDDSKSAQLNALELQQQQAEIAKLQEKLNELSGTSQDSTEVRSKVNGTVKSVSVSAGRRINNGDTAMEIEVSDMGYTMTATVTAEQARLLHVGDTATVNNYYWGNPTTAEITQIKPDPKNPQDSKLLTFSVSGNVSAGSTLSFAIGEKNASYDYVVPTAAVRSDTTGKFLLIITAKNSPLGNRYFATRVNVEVLASDDLNSAVKGPLEGHESVILTTSNNAPLKNGDQVRLPDVN